MRPLPPLKVPSATRPAPRNLPHRIARAATAALLGAATAALLSAAAGPAVAAEYVLQQPIAIDAVDLQVVLEPGAHEFRARAELTLRARGEAVSSFDLWLNRGFRIDDLRPARRVRYQWQRHREAPHFAPTTRPIHFELAPALPPGETLRVMLFYQGRLPGLVNGVNQIGPDLVELALYSGWFPRAIGAGEFDVRLDVEAPSAMQVISFEEPVEVRPGRRRTRTIFDMRSRSEDVVLLAGTGLSSAERERDGFRARVYHRDLEERVVSDVLDAMLWVEEFYRSRLGFPRGAEEAVLFASPRSGWNYVRFPLLILSGEALEAGVDTSSEAGRRNLKTVAHEMAHLWWRLADHYTYDDWLNEGLAEYSAWRVMEARHGEDSSRELLRDYLHRVRDLPRPLSIGVTLRSDPESATLFFAKAALVLRLLAWVMGEEAFLATLDEYYRTYAGAEAEAGDTVAFRRIAERHYGESLIWFFQPWVYDAILPRLDLDYQVRVAAPGRWTVEGTIRQPEASTIRIPVEVAAVGEEGEREVRAVEMEGPESSFSFELAFRPLSVELDPDRKVPRREVGGSDGPPGGPREVEELLRVAREREGAGRAREAAAIYEGVLRVEPENFYALYRLGRLAFRAGEAETALERHRAADEARAGYARLWGWNLVRIGEIEAHRERPGAAREAYRAALREQDHRGSHAAARDGMRGLDETPPSD